MSHSYLTTAEEPTDTNRTDAPVSGTKTSLIIKISEILMNSRGLPLFGEELLELDPEPVGPDP